MRVPSEGDPAAPKCVVRVDFLSHNSGQLRGDLEAVAFCEYVVGGPTARKAGGRAAVVPAGGTVKGLAGSPVRMFASHDLADMPDEIRKPFAQRWLRCDPQLGGQDRRKWTIEDAWCVHLMRRELRADQFRVSAREARHYRIRFCPEQNSGQALAAAGRMEEAARRFMRALEDDYRAQDPTSAGAKRAHRAGTFWWVAAAHYNTATPHVHIGMRGIDVDRSHVYFEQRYLRPTKSQLKRDPAASSPIEWRARMILRDMVTGEARHAS